MAEKPDTVIAAIVKLLYDEGAMTWDVQDKGALVAAVKLQLSEKEQQTQEVTSE
jgi:hypothetical protein